MSTTPWITADSLPPIERHAVAFAFQACLPYIWDGNGLWIPSSNALGICGALNRARNNSSTTWPYAVAGSIIRQRLAGSTWAENWLEKQGVSEEALLNSGKVQRWRKAWVKKLAKEFSK